MITVQIDSGTTKDEKDLAARLADVVKAASKGVGEVSVNIAQGRETTTAPSAPKAQSGVLKIDRIDFVPASTRCFACHRPLTSGTAFLVKTAAGPEHPYGPTCVERRVPGAKNQVYPNFTRASKNQPSEGGKKKKTATKHKKTPLQGVEEEYLLLRYEKLSGYSIPGFEMLDAVYTEFKQTGTLASNGRGFVKKLMEKIPTSKFPGLSLENLQACYAYGHCIAQAISMLPETKRGFLQKLLADLQAKLYLTDHQVEAANNWLSKFSDLAELDAAPFRWAQHNKD